MSYKFIFNLLLQNKDKLARKIYKNRAKALVIWFTENLRIKKNKMKTAKTGFISRKLFYGNVEIFEFWDMKFVNQDNSEAERLSLENRIKALEWKADAKNLFASAVLITLISLLIYSNLYLWYCNELSTLAFRDSRFDALINFALYSNFIEPNFLLFPQLVRSNYWLVETLTTACADYGMLF